MTDHVTASATDPVPDRPGWLEGEKQVDVYDPANPAHRITDIDDIKDGVLWEEKSPTWAGDVDDWAERQVEGKFNKYLRARAQLPYYENAPIGFRFTTPGVEAELRQAIEAKIAELRQANPDVDIRLDWA